MKITLEMIEESAQRYLKDNRHVPHYVLMSEDNYEEFNEMLEAKTRSPSQGHQILGVTVNLTGSNHRVTVLSIKTNKDLFEVVG